MQKQKKKRSDTVFPSLQPSQNLRSFSPSHGLVQKNPLNARVNLLKWRCNKPCLRKTTHSGSTPDRVEKQSLTIIEYLPQLPGSYLRSNKSQPIFSQIFSLHFPSIFCESSILSLCVPVGRGRAHLQQNNSKMCVIWILSFRSQHFLPRRRDPERGLQSNQRNPKPETQNRLWGPLETRNPKPETRNPKRTVKVGVKLRNPKPKTPHWLWRLGFLRIGRNPKAETRNPNPETNY